jgi:tetratricopeptide (TPR) repeat protein
MMFKALSDSRCINILRIISVEPSYVGELASTLKTTESRISEKVRIMKEAGIISEEWRRTGNKLVKFYKPSIKKISISFGDGSIKTETVDNKVEESPILQDVDIKVPTADKLVGRTAEMQFVEKYAHVLVTGIPGIGKTTLVANYVRSSNREIFWHDIGETDTLKHIIMKIASYLSKNRDDNLLNALKQVRDKRTHINLAIAGIRKLNSIVVLDDLHKCLDHEIMELINDLISSVPELKVILISRTPLSIYSSSIRVLVLQELQTEEALELIKNTTERERIVAQVGGHPLIVKLAGNLQSTIKRSTESLSPTEYFEKQILPTLPKHLVAVLEKISFFGGTVNLEELEFIFGEISKTHLRETIGLGLIRIQRNSIRMNDLVREVLQISAPRSSETHKKIALYYTSKKRPEYLMMGLHHIALSGSNEEISNFLKQFGMDLINSSYLNNFQEELIKIERSLESCETKAEILYWIGRILANKRMFNESLTYFERARMCPQPSSLEASLLFDEATAYQNIGELEKSEEMFWYALPKVEGSNSIQEGRILFGLGRVLVWLGKQDVARKMLNKASEIFKGKGDAIRYNVALFGIAHLEFVTGNIREAIRVNDQAIEGFLELQAINSYTSSLINKGGFLFLLGKRTKSLTIISEAIEILGTLEYADLDLAFALLKRSVILITFRKIKEAEVDIKRAKKIIKSGGDEFLTGLLYLSQGILSTAKGKLADAEIAVRNAMRYEKLDPVEMYRVRREWSLILIKKGERKQGMKVMRDLMKDFKKRNYIAFLRETQSIYNEIRG